jgi:hypothetical protein
MWIVLAKQNDWGIDVSSVHPAKIRVHKIQSCCTHCIMENLQYICLMWMQLHQFCCIARLWVWPTHLLIKLYHRFLTIVSSLATVSSSSYLSVICLANAAYVFAFNQELTRDTGNCVPLEKLIAVSLRKNVPTVCAFQIFFAVFTRTRCGAPPEPDKSRSQYSLISFHLLLDMRGDPKNYRNF